MFDPKTSAFAAEKMGLPEGWEIKYQSIQVSLIYDTEALAQRIFNNDPDESDAYYVEEMINDAQTYIDLPPGLRLVGMALPKSEDMKFGLVDFSELGAA